jgi:hypothetical protein
MLQNVVQFGERLELSKVNTEIWVRSTYSEKQEGVNF